MSSWRASARNWISRLRQPTRHVLPNAQSCPRAGTCRGSTIARGASSKWNSWTPPPASTQPFRSPVNAALARPAEKWDGNSCTRSSRTCSSTVNSMGTCTPVMSLSPAMSACTSSTGATRWTSVPSGSPLSNICRRSSRATPRPSPTPSSSSVPTAHSWRPRARSWAGLSSKHWARRKSRRSVTILHSPSTVKARKA